MSARPAGRKRSLAAAVRRVSVAIAQVSARLLPRGRADWAAAMVAEVRHCERGRDAIDWALGCVFAAVKERITSMVKGNLRISGWVAVPEMILCFAPLTLACVDAMQSLGMLLHSRVPVGPGDWAVVTAMAALGAIGPLALIGAFRLFFIEKPMRAPWCRAAVIAGPVLFGVLLLIQAAAGWLDASQFDFWCAVVLLSALPALGAAHLVHLSATAHPDRAVPGPLTHI
ncbi:MAG TPA: hypothetical protein VHZ53_14970 [Steroidobacteraceae bacterium]|jgi:hypothetical protein|nr:hypothetical protein [Steroidobacteraceae bacterium]